MFYTIYKTTNLLDGKIYIGKHQTLDPNDHYLGSGNMIANAIRKHGVENFSKEILFIFETEAEMNAKEVELVTEEFCLREDTYNITPGGQGGWSYVNSYNPSSRTLGKKYSIDSRKKMSVAQSGPRNSQYGLQWITNGVESTRIKKDDPIPKGWKKGRKKTWKYGRVVYGSGLENQQT